MQVKNIGSLLFGGFLVALSVFFIFNRVYGFSIFLSLLVGLGLIIHYISKNLNKEFIPLEEIIERQKKHQTRITRIFDRLTFFDMFMIWVLIISIFGVTFYFSADLDSYLLYSKSNQAVTSLADSIYFSFITATSTGFGDIIPYGHFKTLAIFEVVFGLVLLATLTSKLVSIKEDAILNEIYEISFNERLSRLRSSLLAFRQNLGRMMTKIEENSISKREVDDIYVYISFFETALNEVITFFGKSESNLFLKQVDPVNTELIFNSILQSFQKLDELILVLKHSRMQWKRDITVEMIKRSLHMAEKLFDQLNASKTIPEKIMHDMNSQKSRILASVKDGLL